MTEIIEGCSNPKLIIEAIESHGSIPLRAPARDFTVKSESISRKRTGKREYLNDAETRHMMMELERVSSSRRLRSLS